MKKSKHKIVHIVDNLAIGGVPMVVIDLCNYLKDDFEISIICLTDQRGMLKRKPIDEGISIYYFNYNYPNKFSTYGYLKEYFKRSLTDKRASNIIEKIYDINPDIIHFHVNPMELIIGHICKSRIPSINLIYSDHVLRIKRTDYTFINRYIIKRIFKLFYSPYNVISVSEKISEEHINNNVLNSKKQHQVIENKINLSNFSIQRQQSESINVLYIARLSFVKGHRVLLNAWSKIDNPNCHLYLVGGGELESEMKQLAKRLNIYHNITFVGDTHDIKKYLSIADIGVFPSNKEGLPIALLEKMIAGIPIIASNIEELKHLITDGQNGLLFESNNSEKLAEQLIRLINDNELRDFLGKNAKEFVKNRFSSTNFGKQYLEFYNHLLQTNDLLAYN